MTNYHGIIGIARADITPPVGIFARNWGAATHDVAAGVHMPLTLTCITFQTDKNALPLVLFSADLGWWKSAADERNLRHGILKALSLPEERLMFCLTHTHAGPSTFSEDAGKPGGHLIIPFLQQLQETAVHAAREAMATAQPATLTWQYGRCNLAVNRDFPEPGGNRLVVGYNPAAAADDTVLTGRITNADGRIMGTIVNYACHPTTLAWENQLLSPDYIGGMRGVVEPATGAPCLFLQGASGELSPAEQYSGDTSLADGYGRQLGFAVLSTLEGMLPPDTELTFTGVVESGASLAIWKKSPAPADTTLMAEMTTVEMVLKPMPSLSEIEAAWATCEDHVVKERLWRQRGIRKTVGEGTVANMPLWIWRLGNTILAGQPNEAYSGFQLELRRELAPAAVAVMNIVNGYAGYLPPSASFNHQSYAVWQTPFEKGSLEQLIRSATTISQRMIRTA
ncbi:hypothetical protein HHL17_14590 [Chitinophaga sp. G-6-1-13]|uniref:Neutral/alkaline non-lysosomal ceramidase N-terminal domain-containing protein n=1 Tax=Chitinophaga fulva TaxID=2728842 RepID=A0A848GNT1_9BACT|nr:hypothetical protein [Chitinophaga fulva]NML38433.1 hypothetical protein [Chitinophaga fulva]